MKLRFPAFLGLALALGLASCILPGQCPAGDVLTQHDCAMEAKAKERERLVLLLLIVAPRSGGSTLSQGAPQGEPDGGNTNPPLYLPPNSAPAGGSP